MSRRCARHGGLALVPPVVGDARAAERRQRPLGTRRTLLVWVAVLAVLMVAYEVAQAGWHTLAYLLPGSGARQRARWHHMAPIAG